MKIKSFASLWVAIVSLGVMVSCVEEKLHHKSILRKLEESTGIPPQKKEIPLNARLLKSSVDGEQTDTVWVQNRTRHINKFPCSECHLKGGKAKSPSSNSSFSSLSVKNKKAHWDIVLEHGDNQIMQSCVTCHGKQMENNNLTTPSLGKVSFDEVYNLCTNCHFSVRKDWEGGAHGKRATGWLSTRVIKNCTDCHNPHQPKFPPGFPATTMQNHSARQP